MNPYYFSFPGARRVIYATTHHDAAVVGVMLTRILHHPHVRNQG